MVQLFLIKSSHKVEWPSRAWSECCVHCQEAKADAIIANNSEVAPNIALLALRGKISEQILPTITLISTSYSWLYFYNKFGSERETNETAGTAAGA